MTYPGILEAQQPMDPADSETYWADFSNMLDLTNSEIINSFTIALVNDLSEYAITLGTGDYAAVRDDDNTSVRFSVVVGEAQQANAVFGQLNGLPVAVRVTATTNSNPARTLQRTVYVRIQQL